MSSGTQYPHGNYWKERKWRRNLARERVLRKARAEAKDTGHNLDIILISWGARPRKRGKSCYL